MKLELTDEIKQRFEWMKTAVKANHLGLVSTTRKNTNEVAYLVCIFIYDSTTDEYEIHPWAELFPDDRGIDIFNDPKDVSNTLTTTPTTE